MKEFGTSSFLSYHHHLLVVGFYSSYIELYPWDNAWNPRDPRLLSRSRFFRRHHHILLVVVTHGAPPYRPTKRSLQLVSRRELTQPS